MKESDKNEDLHDLEILITREILTPLGLMVAGATPEGLCLLEFADRPSLESEIKDLERYLNAKVIEGTNKYIDQAEQELLEYFSGSRKCFEVELLFPGTRFQMQVWNSLLKIPYGETLTYLEQSQRLGIPESIRAVAHANGCNRISILIPCHRVIGKNGKLTGYGGGIERKRKLLLHEMKFAPVVSGLFA
jgi:AraC family transcriptional regulator of adaptative response/methylated-DNA-[protein]-cysteine methyltransferase